MRCTPGPSPRVQAGPGAMDLETTINRTREKVLHLYGMPAASHREGLLLVQSLTRLFHSNGLHPLGWNRPDQSTSGLPVLRSWDTSTGQRRSCST